MTTKKKCTCCKLHNSTNEGKSKSIIHKYKWINVDSLEVDSCTYRITVDAFDGDFETIRQEAEAYGTVIKCEKEVVDNG